MQALCGALNVFLIFHPRGLSLYFSLVMVMISSAVQPAFICMPLYALFFPQVQPKRRSHTKRRLRFFPSNCRLHMAKIPSKSTHNPINTVYFIKHHSIWRESSTFCCYLGFGFAKGEKMARVLYTFSVIASRSE